MWSDAPDLVAENTGSQPPELPRYYALLLKALVQSGVQPDPGIKPYIQHRIELIGDTEWRKLPHLNLASVDPAKAKRWLGWGFSITEFLAAPASPRNSRLAVLCSLGALVNLLIVVCDSLLDAGETISQVLPAAELAASGGQSSPVTILLGEYFRLLAVIQPNDRLLRSIHKIVSRMFESEIQTISGGSALLFSFWLRKSALPFVLMGLPAGERSARDFNHANRKYLAWLYRVGRFFGALDDSLDLEEDARAGQPNYLLRYPENLRPDAVARIAAWGTQVLMEWDALISANKSSSLPREVFLHTIWGC